ncbi:hypothetical protein D3C75_526420 [compost metagenome]
MGSVRCSQSAEGLKPCFSPFTLICRYGHRILKPVSVPVDAGAEQSKFRAVIEEGRMLHNMVRIADVAAHLPVKSRGKPVSIRAVFGVVGMIVIGASLAHRHFFAKAFIRLIINTQILIETRARQRLHACAAIAVPVRHI